MRYTVKVIFINVTYCPEQDGTRYIISTLKKEGGEGWSNFFTAMTWFII